MPGPTDVQLKERLGKILPANKVAAIVRMLGREEYQTPEGLERLQGHLETLGIPAEGMDQILGIAQDRGSEAQAAKEKEWGGLVTDTPEEIMGELGPEAIVPDFSGIDFSQVDLSGLGQNPAEQPAAEGEDIDDMSWLGDKFKEQEITTADALKYGTSADPSQEASQKAAINELFDIYRQGGNTAQDRAARAKNRAGVENLISGQNAATMQDMAERGMGGSGAELASMLGNAQAAGSRLSLSDLQTSADSEARALNALMGGQQAASGLQGQQNQYVQNNAGMLQQAAKSNADFLRQGYLTTMAQRNNWDLQTLLAKIGAAEQQQRGARDDQQYGYGLGSQLATHGSDAFGAGQGAANQAGMGAFTGAQPYIQHATDTRIEKTGGTQAAAGKSASGGAKFAGDIVTGLYGGKK